MRKEHKPPGRQQVKQNRSGTNYTRVPHSAQDIERNTNPKDGRQYSTTEVELITLEFHILHKASNEKGTQTPMTAASKAQ